MLRSTGAKIFALIVAVPAVALVCLGVVRLRDSLLSPTQIARSYAKLVAEEPQRGWYRVAGCRLDFSRAVVETSHNVPVRAYVPVFDANNAGQKSTHFFAEMDDRKTTVLFLDMTQSERYDTPQQQEQWWRTHAADLVAKRDLSGLVTRGIYRPTANLNAKFAEVADTDSNQFILLAEGWKPDPGRGYLMTGLGVAGCLFVLACLVANRPGRR